MDACLLIRERLTELGRDQKDLAAAAEVTESYVSQLLTRKKPPPAPGRTDIYAKMEDFLELPRGRLADLAELQRTDALRRRLASAPRPLDEGVRDFVLRKCLPSSEPYFRAEFEKAAFGPLERLVTQKLLDVVQRVLRNESLPRGTDRAPGATRAARRRFLETDVLALSAGQCRAFLDPVIESWDIDLVRFGMDIVLDRRFGPDRRRRLELVETAPRGRTGEEPGLTEFLRDASLGGDATGPEIEFLRSLRFGGRRPTALYFYRELQSLRDPLHFPPQGEAWARPRGDRAARGERS